MPATVLVVTLLLLAVTLASGLWIGVSLFYVGGISLFSFTSLPVERIVGSVIWNNTSSSTLMALPLFIMMGELLVKTRLSEDLFDGLTPWLGRLPGGLLHVNVVACALFAAITGSVNATTATVGKITIPEFEKRGYSDSLSIGSLTASGTLGILIPPSMPMLIYGVVAQASIGKLFIAGLIPGLGLMFLFSLYIAVMSFLDRKEGGEVLHFSWGERFRSLPKILPVAALIAFVLGSIYTGWATPTEAAAIGVLGASVLALLTGCLDRKIFWDCVTGTVKTNCMIMLILIGASFFSVALGFLGLPKYISESIIALGAGKYTVMALITVVYLFLGCLIDGYSMIVMTVPIFLPLVTALGLDSIWFGIYVVLLVQIANITPPIGFNLFLVTGICRHKIGFISKAVMPFIAMMIAFAFLMTAFPQIVLYLPSLM
ncbi:MAG: TRAP transporter large permease subunit [Synergistaceae bacterium]|nr:TRAP transporter large permease subunit [Synergistaceae bacterium]